MSGKRGMTRYSQEEIEFCRNNYSNKTIKELAAELNRSEGGIRTLLERQGIYKKVWTETRLTFLKKHCLKDYTVKETAQYLGLTYHQVLYKLKQLGIKKHNYVIKTSPTVLEHL